MRFTLKLWDYLAGLAVAGLSLALLPLPLAAFAAALGALAVLIAAVDLDRYIIPDTAVLALLALGLLLAAVEGTAAGPWLMWPTLPFAVAVAAVAALLTAGARAVLLRERMHSKQELPFGAFLAPAVWMSFVIERLWWLPA